MPKQIWVLRIVEYTTISMLDYFKYTLDNVEPLKPDCNRTRIMWLKSKISALNMSQIEKKLSQIQ